MGVSLDGSRPDVIHETMIGMTRDDNRHLTFEVVTPQGDLIVDADSFKGDTGLFNGLDPVVFLSVRNNGLRPLTRGIILSFAQFFRKTMCMTRRQMPEI